MNIQITPYKINKSSIEKYHIIRLDSSQIIYRICNIYAPFGRQTEHYTSNNLTQHRLNIGFSTEQILNNDKSYLELSKIIQELEIYFSTFDELKDYELVSNIINRDTYGIIIRFHLKTQNNKTTTPLTQIVKSEDIDVEWIQFDKTKQINIDITPDCLWIDNKNKKYGISFVINKVFQFIS
jgi:hypothetical protein